MGLHVGWRAFLGGRVLSEGAKPMGAVKNNTHLLITSRDLLLKVSIRA